MIPRYTITAMPSYHPTTLVLLLLTVLPATGQTSKKAKTAKRPGNSPLAAIADDPDLPRVLLIGDSISIGYTRPTRKLLAGRANLHRIPTNGGPTTKGLQEIDTWLGPKQWDVIHFNWGLHDLKYMNASGGLTDPDKGKQQVPIKAYEKNLDRLVRRLKKTRAKLIWRNTTPVPPGSKGRIPGNAARYNTAAARVMTKHKIPTQDLYSFSKKRMDSLMRKANVHFTTDGSQALAREVAAAITQQLESWSPRPQTPPRKGKRHTIELFDGSSLTGWVGHAKHWSVKDGTIIGKNTQPVTVSTYLLTERSFSDFRLTATVRLATSEMHSGIAFWGRNAPEHGDAHTYAGHLVMFPSNWGFYDLFGRKGLGVNGGYAKVHGHQHDWNQLEILAQGNRIRLVVNGALVADWYDPEPDRIREGPIGLQLHSNKVPQEVQFKELTLTAFPEDKLITLKR